MIIQGLLHGVSTSTPCAIPAPSFSSASQRPSLLSRQARRCGKADQGATSSQQGLLPSLRPAHPAKQWSRPSPGSQPPRSPLQQNLLLPQKGPCPAQLRWWRPHCCRQKCSVRLSFLSSHCP